MGMFFTFVRVTLRLIVVMTLLAAAGAVGGRLIPQGSQFAYVTQTVQRMRGGQVTANTRLMLVDAQRWLAVRVKDVGMAGVVSDGTNAALYWSPDGERIAYLADENAGRTLYVIAWDGRPILRFDAPVLAIEIHWSPDSANLFFSAYSVETGWDVYSIPVPTAPADPDDPTPSPTLRLIAQTTRNDYGAAMSPDGSRLALITEYGSEQGARLIVSAFPLGEHGTPLTVATESGVIWSLRDPQYTYQSPLRWSPDGSRLIFTVLMQQRFENFSDIFQIDFRVNPPAWTRIATAQRVDSPPVWSPDGTQIAYLSTLNSYRAIVLQSALSSDTSDAASRPTRLTDRRYDNISGLGWSPDGKWLIFSARELGSTLPGGDRNEIYLIDLATRRIFPVTRSPYDDYSPAWRPVP
jgi:Tol biopolymer transport system component